MSEKKRVLMVCLGNICRSPMAEGVFREKTRSSNIEVEIDSAGTSNYHVGQSPDARAIQTLRRKQIDISALKARAFSVDDFDKFDFIFAMDEANLSDILSMARDKGDTKKVDLLLNLSHPGSNREVPDPFYGGSEGFEHIYSMIDEACEDLVKRIALS